MRLMQGNSGATFPSAPPALLDGTLNFRTEAKLITSKSVKIAYYFHHMARVVVSMFRERIDEANFLALPQYYLEPVPDIVFQCIS